MGGGIFYAIKRLAFTAGLFFFLPPIAFGEKFAPRDARVLWIQSF